MLVCRAFADVFEGRQAAQGLQWAAVSVGIDAVEKMSGRVCTAILMIAYACRFLGRAVHPPDQAIGPGMRDLVQPLFDLIFIIVPVGRASLEPVGKSLAAVRSFHFATVFWLIP